MPFIASSGLTEEGTSRTVEAGGTRIHYHELGAGEPVLFLHAYGPGTTAWIVFHRAIGALAPHFRCILMDLPNFSKTGPIVYREGVHAVQARTAVALLDALGIERAVFAGHDWGGFVAWAMPVMHPERCAGVIGVNTPYVPFPTTERLRDILLSRLGQLPSTQGPLIQDALEFFARLRENKVLKRQTSPAELIDWLTYMLRRGAKPKHRLDDVRSYAFAALSALTKDPKDQDAVKSELESFLEGS